MMVSQKEKAAIRRFVCGQLCAEPDLSTLTIGILKKRYLAHVKCEALSSEVKLFLKQVVQEELVKMQNNDENGSDVENKMPQNKRKREEENEEVTSDESMAKKSRLQLSSSEESEDEKGQNGTNEKSEEKGHIKSGSEDDEQEGNKLRQKTIRKSERQVNSEDSSDEGGDESEKESNQTNCDNSPDKMLKNKTDTAKKGETGRGSTSQGKTVSPSDGESDSHSDTSSDKVDKGSDSSDNSDEEKARVEEKNKESDSSSLPSLEDEVDRETENTQDQKTKKKQKKEKSTKSQQDEKRAIVRLKHYIVLCGVRRNYKKLLGNCHSSRSQIAVLKKELEDLGVKGQPSIEKCKKVREKREQAQEIAELDVSNIITTQGRPKRRGTSARLEQLKPLTSTYVRSLNSSSDSDQENKTHTGHKKTTDWDNLRGIISDDASSD